MIDREVALRFVAFWHLGAEHYTEETDGTLDSFLLRATRSVDEPRTVTDVQLDQIASAFAQGLDNAYTIFAEYAFRKWPSGDDSRKPFNRALFECWSVELARHNRDQIKESAYRIREVAREAFKVDMPYLASVTAGTGSALNVEQRFRHTRALIADALG